ncbi:bifunctional diguanylate cyclase/phosphodiesterase [Chroococcus sp. FPU101]|uniref:sensor domain-containing protein n=1 Tax=Chroococcus sp. FPU101 TaxID=1974212 RepID=UPI001A8F0092|nr:GGDEF domain-containing protein [Chroococcus sp. FPU101]
MIYTLKKEIKLRQEIDRRRKIAEDALQESENRYRKIVENQTDFLLHSLPDTTITYANRSLCEALGVTLNQIVGKKWLDFANREDLEKDVFQEILKLTPDLPNFVAENRDQRSNGEIGWTHWLNQGIFNEHGELVEIQSVGRDITHLKLVEIALRHNEERLRLVTENMRDLVCLHEINGKYLYVTPSSQFLLGYHPEELMGQNLESFLHENDYLHVLQKLSLLSNLEASLMPLVYRMRKKTGDYVWLETLIQPILNKEGEISHLQSTSRDVSERILMEQKLKHDALYDSLTGLGNRTLLINRLEQTLKQIKRSSMLAMAVLFLDLDNFKFINDSLGHLIGDKLLKVIATKLIKCVREVDLVARLGGDEFVILLEKINRVDEAICIASRILNTLATSIVIDDREIFVTTSIGIVLGNHYYDHAEELIRDADLAMYQAKSQGKGCYAIL